MIYADRPLRSHFASTKDYQKAYRKFYKAIRPKYLQEWLKRPETPEHYKPKPITPCPKCGADRTRLRESNNHPVCIPCRNAKAARAEIRKQKAASKEAKDKEKIARIQQRLEKRAASILEREAELKAKSDVLAEQYSENLKLAQRHSPLSEYWFFTNDEISRFWSKVHKTPECWLWTGSKERKLECRQFSIKIHRVSWFLAHGPCSTIQLQRSCGNSLCVNPAHLEIYDAGKIAMEAMEFKEQFKVHPGKNKPIPIFPDADIKRFWSYVDKSLPCWVWTAGKHQDGYGKFFYRQVSFPAHRVAYLLHHGSIDQKLQIMHSCDSPFCVNPNHLSQGTNIDNFLDAKSKGRTAFKGNPFTSRNLALSNDDRKQVTDLLSRGVKPTVLSQKFGVPVEVINGG